MKTGNAEGLRSLTDKKKNKNHPQAKEKINKGSP